MSTLYSSSTLVSRHGAAGQPFPQDLKMKDEAEKALTDLSRTSAAYNLYDSIRKSAEENIKQSLKLAEMMDD